MLSPQAGIIHAVGGSMGDSRVSGSYVIGLQYTSEGRMSYVLRKSEDDEIFVFEEEGQERERFRILPYKTAAHRKLKLLDEYGRQIAIVKEKNMTVHARCEGYRCHGEGKLNREKAFSIFKPCVLGNRTDLRVTLENSSSEDIGYKIIVNSMDNTCRICMGDGSAVIAQTLLRNGNTFSVEVSPNVDCAFVFLLIAAVNAMNSPRKAKCAADRAFKCAACIGGNILIDELCQGGF